MSDKKNNGIFDWEIPTIYDIINRMKLSFILPPEKEETKKTKIQKMKSKKAKVQK